MKRNPVKETIPEPVWKILEGVLARSNTLTRFHEARFLKTCMDRIGLDFCQHMRPLYFKNGVIYCAVDSPSWVQQYQFLSDEMIKKVNHPPLERQVTGFRFAVGSIHEAEYIKDEQDVRHEVQAKPTDEEVKELYTAVEGINPKLREDFKGLIQSWTGFDSNQPKQDVKK